MMTMMMTTGNSAILSLLYSYNEIYCNSHFWQFVVYCTKHMIKINFKGTKHHRVLNVVKDKRQYILQYCPYI